MNFQRPSPKRSAIDIAPLVDVVFLLLLFFVLSYNPATESAIEVLLPTSSEADESIPESINVTIQDDGKVFLNGTPYPLPELAAALRDLRFPDHSQAVSIHAHQGLEVGQLMKVVDAVKQAGCTSFSIVTRMIE